jgi:hypothetical protein
MKLFRNKTPEVADCISWYPNSILFLIVQVSTHLSSVKDLYVQDGAVGSSLKCGAKVRIIADNPSAILSLSNILWKTPSRAISHDTCPLTIYVASSIKYILVVYVDILFLPFFLFSELPPKNLIVMYIPPKK